MRKMSKRVKYWQYKAILGAISGFLGFGAAVGLFNGNTFWGSAAGIVGAVFGAIGGAIGSGVESLIFRKVFGVGSLNGIVSVSRRFCL